MAEKDVKLCNVLKYKKTSKAIIRAGLSGNETGAERGIEPPAYALMQLCPAAITTTFMLSNCPRACLTQVSSKDATPATSRASHACMSA